MYKGCKSDRYATSLCTFLLITHWKNNRNSGQEFPNGIRNDNGLSAILGSLFLL